MPKWKHIGLLAPGGQRLWEGCVGEYYLTDQSGDDDPCRVNSYTSRVGKPDETDDGPCRVLRHEPLIVGDSHIVVRVMVERDEKEGSIFIGAKEAATLVERLDMKVQLGELILERAA